MNVATILDGKRYGPACPHKLFRLPTPLVDMLEEACGKVAGREVVELGVWEGHYSLDLLSRGARVAAVEGRKVNVEIASRRVEEYGYDRDFVIVHGALENGALMHLLLGDADVCMHTNVLQHLKDPVAHLIVLSHSHCPYLFFQTHVTSQQRVNGIWKGFSIEKRNEYTDSPYRHVGMHAFNRRLMLDDIRYLLEREGYKVEVLKKERMKDDHLKATFVARR